MRRSGKCTRLPERVTWVGSARAIGAGVEDSRELSSVASEAGLRWSSETVSLQPPESRVNLLARSRTL